MKQVQFNVIKSLNCDVLVVGGGTSGIAAAICAARNGAKTILAEKSACLGGTATAGMISTFMTSLNVKGDKQIIRGFYKELVDRMAAEGISTRVEEGMEPNSICGYRDRGHKGCVAYQPDGLKRLAETMCREAGVEIYYNYMLAGCETESGAVKAAYFAAPEGIYEVCAKQFIDTTGDAFLAAAAGAQTATGDEEGFTQTASLFFSIRGVDKALLDQHMFAAPDMKTKFYMEEIAAAREAGTFPCGTAKLRIYEGINGVWSVNMAQVDRSVNATDSKELTDALMDQRQQIEQIFRYLKENIPACKNIEWVRSAEILGLREGRRLVGEYVLTADDMMSSTQFEDAVVYCTNSIDIHRKVGVDYRTYLSEKSYTIPLRSLMAKELSNLMVAGRCLSATHEALAAVRVMPPCFAMGQAVGTAAAVAVREGTALKATPFAHIREAMAKDGCYFE